MDDTHDRIDRSREPATGRFLPPDPDGRTKSSEVAFYRDIAREDRGLTASEYRCLDAQLSFADSGGKVPLGNCFPGRDALAKRAGMSINSIRRAIEGLTRKGFIERIPFRHVQSKKRTAPLIRFRLPPCEMFPYGWEGPIHSRRQGFEPVPKRAPRNSDRATGPFSPCGSSEGSSA